MGGIKKSSVALISCIAALFIFFVVISNFGNAQSSTITETSKNQDAIKIPPPIEGVIPFDTEESQNLKKANISILNAAGKRLEYYVELAITHEEQRIGMMFREYIDKNTGMLFLFDSVGKRSFWMRNTLIPLDIIFIRRDGVIHYIHPMAEVNSLDRIGSQGDIYAVLEIAGGESEILGINVGDRVLYDAFSLKISDE